MPKLIYSKVQEVLEYFKGTILNNNQIKSVFTVNAGFADYLFEKNNTVFLIYIKWDKGSMSENNINLFIKACSYITSHISMIGKQFYGIIISKRPTHPFKMDRLVNIHLDHVEVNILEEGFANMNVKDMYVNAMEIDNSKSKEVNSKLENEVNSKLEGETKEIQMKLYSYISTLLISTIPITQPVAEGICVSMEVIPQQQSSITIDTDSDMC